MNTWAQWAIVAVPGLPTLAFVVLGVWLFAAKAPSERAIARLASATFSIAAIASIVVVWGIITHGERVVPLGTWFHAGSYHFEFGLRVDVLSAAMMALVTLICGLIGRFSVNYLHREAGFARFFLLLFLFATGMLLLVMASGIDQLFVGWELVGLTSALLVGFFFDREGPARAGVRVLATYRIADVGLLVGAVLLHQYAHTADFGQAFAGRWPLGVAHLTPGQADQVALLFLWAAMGKSAQFPLGGWLPHAMEGPTPSSALFYGALSVHAGVYLLLRISPILEQAAFATYIVAMVGLVTALHGALVYRVQTDAKSALAYATVTQVGLIVMEVGLGFYRLAIFHLFGHAVLRTFQLLRAPSALRDALNLQQTLGAAAHPQSKFARWLPPRWRPVVYGLALERFHLDALQDRWLLGPLFSLALWLDQLEQAALRGLVRASKIEARHP